MIEDEKDAEHDTDIERITWDVKRKNDLLSLHSGKQIRRIWQIMTLCQ